MKSIRNIISIISICAAMFTVSCADYLDVVPDNITTVDHAFKTRYTAQGFLYGIYANLPEFANTGSNPALMGGDEIWFSIDGTGVNGIFWNIPKGAQGASAPLANYWSSRQNGNNALRGGKPMFTALRDCNIFLENIHLPFDLPEEERKQWIGEALFLKAYFHYWLFRMYGPIPLMKNNIVIDAVENEARPYREPVDEVVEYIASLLDSAAAKLPLTIEDQINDMGKPTKVIAFAVKAQLLTLAASPLFNGTEEDGANPDYANIVDKRGIHLFPQAYSAEKWQKAARALKEAIDLAEEANHRLYDFAVNNPNLAPSLSKKTILSMQVRGAVTEKWNEEIIWGDSRTNPSALQQSCQPVFLQTQAGGSVCSNYAPTQRIVDQFYTANGLPIEEDKEWTNIDAWEMTTATADDKLYIKEGYRTFRQYFNREARFYGSIIFAGGRYFGNNTTMDSNLGVIGELGVVPVAGYGDFQKSSTTGYLCKKLLNYRTAINGTSVSTSRYSFPIIRLADLYLMYAEALNEAGGTTPSSEVYMYIDSVRARTGLEGVVKSWSEHAIDSKKTKPLTKSGMRDIIRRERLNELAFEGARFWDLKRWKLAESYFNNTPIRGILKDENGNISVRELYRLQYSKKDYLWPIKVSNLANNTNLVQNPGW